MTQNVIINKCNSIMRCLKRIREDYQNKEQFLSSFTLQDAVTLNLQRACEQSIDLAAYLGRLKGLGVPQSSKEEFLLLEQAGIISKQLSGNLQGMVGYRNIAVHEYQKLSLPITLNILDNHLQDFEHFVKAALGVLPP